MGVFLAQLHTVHLVAGIKKTENARVVSISYTLHPALRKQDFKARRSFLAHFRNHGRFLSSTSQHKTLTSRPAMVPRKVAILPPLRTEKELDLASPSSVLRADNRSVIN